MRRANSTTIRYNTITVIIVAVFFLLPVILFNSHSAKADTGPKPSVTVDFTDIANNTTCYGTLLSKTASTGPSVVWDGNDDTKYCFGMYTDEDDKAAWQAFADYTDPDGYYFLQTLWRINKTAKIDWDYYPPSDFKVVIYFPENNLFVSSDKCESYAFHSYFTATVTGDAMLGIEKSYDYTWEIISLAVRIIVTIGIELLIALLFKYKTKFQIITILITNIVTQVSLNIALNILAHYSGGFFVFLTYIPLEISVFIIEAITYSIAFNRFEKSQTLRADAVRTNSVTQYAVLYAFCANAISCTIGFVLATVIPGLF